MFVFSFFSFFWLLFVCFFFNIGILQIAEVKVFSSFHPHVLASVSKKKKKIEENIRALGIDECFVFHFFFFFSTIPDASIDVYI